MSTMSSGKKSSFARPKSAEPSSPLLRRALSPGNFLLWIYEPLLVHSLSIIHSDRLHPRSATETKCSISPLCCTSNAMPTANSINVHAANAVIGLKKQRNSKSTGNIWRQNLSSKPLLSTSESFTSKSYANAKTTEKSTTTKCGDGQSTNDLNTNVKNEHTERDSNTKTQSTQSTQQTASGQSNLSLTLSLPNQSELLPIAEEEKDSPGSGPK